MADGKIKVLYIEDNPADVRIVKEYLKDEVTDNYSFHSVESLSEVKRIDRFLLFDVILLDLNLPGTMGIETLVQTQKLIPHTPVIVLSGHLDLQMETEVIKRGAQDYLGKNYISAGLLKHSIRYAIERHSFFKKVTETHEQFMDLIRKNSDGIIVIDRYGYIRYLNPSCEKLFMRPRNELLNQAFGFPIAVGDFTEINIWSKGGEQKYAEMRISEIKWEGEECFLAAIRDVTERKRIEEKNKEMRESLKKAVSEKDKLFSILAHDLKTPFNGLLSLSSLIIAESEDLSKAELLEYISTINNSAKHLFQLLNNLLDWTLMQKDEIKTVPKIIDISALAEQNKNIIEERARQKKITIYNEIPKNQFVLADERMVDSILRNLLTNAVKFTNKDGVIKIEARTIDDNMLEVSIADTGIGMSQSDIKKLFAVGEKVSSLGTNGEPSSGLGLMLCKEFVEKNNGEIYVSSKVGKGSKFSFTIPCATN